jgi:hypothetical protein
MCTLLVSKKATFLQCPLYNDIFLPASQDAGNGIAFEDNSLHKNEYF